MYRFKCLSSVDFKNAQSLHNGYWLYFLSSKLRATGLHFQAMYTGRTRRKWCSFVWLGALWLDTLLLSFTGQECLIFSFLCSTALFTPNRGGSCILYICLFFPRVLSSQISSVPSCNERGKTLVCWPEPVENPTN